MPGFAAGDVDEVEGRFRLFRVVPAACEKDGPSVGHPGEGFFPAGGGQLPEGVRNKVVQPEIGEITVVVVVGLVDEKADGIAFRGEFGR